MANGPYSRNTFEEFAKIRHYVSVRLKQGVPMVDADWNEMQDLRRYELRNFLRWFVGNGIPGNNNGFRILPSGDPNDVIIAGGDGTPEGGGRCLVDGLEVINPEDVAFSAQEFADPAQAAIADVDPVAMPDTPLSGIRVDLYCLDVWEREITSAETGHEDIVDPRIEIETSRRLRREWAVRVVDQASGVPVDDSPPGHRYYPLASVLRTVGVDIIATGAITDLRRRGVTIQSNANMEQITSDAFGAGYTLDDSGQPSLAMPLRDVINAMLRDGRPAMIGPRVFQTQNTPHNFPCSTLDADGNQWVFWLGEDAGTGTTLFYFQRQLGGAFTSPVAAFTPTGNLWEGIAVTATADGAIWLFYSARVSGEWQILGRRHHDAIWDAEFTVSSGTNNMVPTATTDSNDNIMVAWRQGRVVQSRRYVGGVEQPIVVAAPDDGQIPNKLALLAGDEGAVHLYVVETATAPADWPLLTKTWQAGAWDATYQPVADLQVTSFLDFTVARDRFGGHWFIWVTQLDSAATTVLRAQRIFQAELFDVVQWVADSPRYPSVVLDGNQNLQVFFRSGNQIEIINVIFEV